MDIQLSPVDRGGQLVVNKAGDILTINGQSFDFTGLPDGATIPAGSVPCEWISGPVHRRAGVLHITLVLPCRDGASVARRFPNPIVNAADGPIAFPEA